MTPAVIILGTLAVLAMLVIAGVLWTLRARRMSAAGKREVLSALGPALSQHDPVRRVLALDSVLDLALTQLGYAGSLGDKLKKAGPRIQNLNDVWNAHKLRNQFAHEHSAQVRTSDVDRAVRVLERAIRELAA